jgi:hypothetical protein
MRGFLAALGAVLVGGMTAWTGLVPAEAKETEEFTLGQWGGYVFVDDNTGQFADCTIWAYNDADIQVGISVNKNWNLDLYLNGKTWDLPSGQSYPISYWIDRNSIYHGKAATYSQKVAKIEVERGQAVFDELRSGGQLTFRTQTDDYVFSLRDSNAALNRLLGCVDKYAKGTNTNPFGGGSNEQQQSSGSQNAQPDDNQQQTTSGGGTDSSVVRLKSLTQSTDQVRQFLVDVTGAKPSMITIEQQSFKSGTPNYYFTTPIGSGQFWQEYLGKDNLRDIAVGYLDGYKGECKGEFEQNVTDLVQGKNGQAVLGVASCSKSSYQDDGAEVLSYAMTTSGDVVSIYATYVGGNAAKAKTDTLGKLIARRQEADIQ